jgi:hypothetical protein
VSAATITRYEREDLQRLVRQREKVLKSAAKQRSAELLADFENQMGQRYSFDQDETWDKARKLAQGVVDKAQEQVARRCRELGIPDRFAPSLSLRWHDSGYENTLRRDMDRLRRMAQTQVAAIEAKAIVQIETSCLEAQTALAIVGLTSDAARLFVDKLPKIEALMPALSFREVAGEAEPPVAEQLVNSNALRQRRYRERLRNGNAQQALRDASVTDADSDTEDND